MTYSDAAAELERLIGRDTISVLVAVKRSSINVAAKLLTTQAPGLSDDAREVILRTAIQVNINFNKSQFYAVAWCLGASYNQLAAMFMVTKGTVAAAVATRLSPEVRSEYSVGRSKFTCNIPLSEIAKIRTVYDLLWKEDGMVLSQLNAQQTAARVKAKMKEMAAELEDSIETPSVYDQVLPPKSNSLPATEQEAPKDITSYHTAKVVESKLDIATPVPKVAKMPDEDMVEYLRRKYL